MNKNYIWLIAFVLVTGCTSVQKKQNKNEEAEWHRSPSWLRMIEMRK